MHDLARLWHTAAEQAKRENAERAARVLAHPDLVERLRQEPAAMQDPHGWSGWIPPRTEPEGMCDGGCGRSGRCPRHSEHRTRINQSAIRRQLVDIAAEAMRREQAQLALDEDQAVDDQPGTT